MKLILTLCALTVCSAFSLQAQAPGGGKGQHLSAEERFKKLDTNADGFLSKEEFMAGPFAQKNPDMAAKRYADMDKKGDGKVTLDEFKAAFAQGGGKKGGGAAPAAPATPATPATPAKSAGS